jgi:hypothetical protein
LTAEEIKHVFREINHDVPKLKAVQLNAQIYKQMIEQSLNAALNTPQQRAAYRKFLTVLKNQGQEQIPAPAYLLSALIDLRRENPEAFRIIKNVINLMRAVVVEFCKKKVNEESSGEEKQYTPEIIEKGLAITPGQKLIRTDILAKAQSPVAQLIDVAQSIEQVQASLAIQKSLAVLFNPYLFTVNINTI